MLQQASKRVDPQTAVALSGKDGFCFDRCPVLAKEDPRECGSKAAGAVPKESVLHKKPLRGEANSVANRTPKLQACVLQTRHLVLRCSALRMAAEHAELAGEKRFVLIFLYCQGYLKESARPVFRCVKVQKEGGLKMLGDAHRFAVLATTTRRW
eukprot:GHVN01093467.1.p3 GENE.GHVN01093467.1~~GHVN01093467.1.p3  ORF type:complete len:154 (+),score=8.89 GHVN01093467.1:292-753(+)